MTSYYQVGVQPKSPTLIIHPNSIISCQIPAVDCISSRIRIYQAGSNADSMMFLGLRIFFCDGWIICCWRSWGSSQTKNENGCYRTERHYPSYDAARNGSCKRRGGTLRRGGYNNDGNRGEKISVGSRSWRRGYGGRRSRRDKCFCI